MLSPRWRKVLSDLWSNKTRTLLVVLSIAVGVFAVGMIAGSSVLLSHDLQAANAATNPFSATIDIDQPFDDDLVQVVRHMPGVAEAEGRGMTIVQVRAGSSEAKNTQLNIISDFTDIRIAKITPASGAWPPPRKGLLLERSSLAFLNTRVGDSVTIELPDGSKRAMRVAGTANDINWASQIYDLASAYITRDTARWLGQSGQFTQLRIIVAEDTLNREHIKQVVSQIRDKIEKGGRTVSFVQIPNPPGKHWADQDVQTLLVIMSVLGVISLLLSAFLVVNTIGAILTQQTRQIGVMKAIGAKGGQIFGMYLTMVLIFGLLSLCVAMPLGALGAHVFVNFFAGLLNFDPISSGIPPNVLALEVAAGLFVPLLAALSPIFAGTRITVREAISSYGVGQGRYGTSRIDRMIGRVRGLSRPLLLSLRNTCRRRGRLALTLSTLVLGGAMIISVLSVRESLIRTLDDFFATYSYDVTVFMERPYRITPMKTQALAIPGVVDAESWGNTSGRRVLADRTKTESINILAPPADTKLFQPKIMNGRWLLPEDENAVVIAADLLKTEPDLRLGDDLVLSINRRETSWRIVGIAQVLFAGRQVYANYDYLARVTNQVGRAGSMVVVTRQHDAASRSQVAKELRDRFKQASLNVSVTQTNSDIRSSAEFQFNIIVVLLMVMAVLLAVVGGLGLMGTMSINVLERTREIGVMRAIGASNGAILRIVIVEGVLIGVVSWLIAAVIALPFSKLLSDTVGDTLLKAPPSYIFSTSGALLWLGVVMVLAAVASALPAWNATRVTVRDVLAYE